MIFFRNLFNRNPDERAGDISEAPCDPLQKEAILANWWAGIEDNLAERKAQRHDPHARGWMTRRAGE